MCVFFTVVLDPLRTSVTTLYFSQRVLPSFRPRAINFAHLKLTHSHSLSLLTHRRWQTRQRLAPVLRLRKQDILGLCSKITPPDPETRQVTQLNVKFCLYTYKCSKRNSQCVLNKNNRFKCSDSWPSTLAPPPHALVSITKIDICTLGRWRKKNNNNLGLTGFCLS